jgi:hypothetical protein
MMGKFGLGEAFCRGKTGGVERRGRFEIGLEKGEPWPPVKLVFVTISSEPTGV